MKWTMFLGCLVLALVWSCGRPNFEQHVFAVAITPENGQLQEYLEHHAAIWPEVEKGFKIAGYKEIRLLRFDHFIVMTVTVPVGADLDEMSKKAAASSPKCAEWNSLMDQYQVGIPGTKAAQKWVELEEFYRFSNY